MVFLRSLGTNFGCGGAIPGYPIWVSRILAKYSFEACELVPNEASLLLFMHLWQRFSHLSGKRQSPFDPFQKSQRSKASLSQLETLNTLAKCSNTTLTISFCFGGHQRYELLDLSYIIYHEEKESRGVSLLENPSGWHFQKVGF